MKHKRRMEQQDIRRKAAKAKAKAQGTTTSTKELAFAADGEELEPEPRRRGKTTGEMKAVAKKVSQTEMDAQMQVENVEALPALGDVRMEVNVEEGCERRRERRRDGGRYWSWC